MDCQIKLNNNYDFFFILSVIANLCQLYDLNLNLSQISNDELMKVLDEQTNIYLKKIVEQNEEIIKLLREK